ncbi:hypothetical protein BDW74DRAFT_180181 [Aspergillus multicolor]|uniref:uncharacterized protein n=1 Tax=Aspergillus multicolor TaxID=41759 RepID=UPI003CCD2EFE
MAASMPLAVYTNDSSDSHITEAIWPHMYHGNITVGDGNNLTIGNLSGGTINIINNINYYSHNVLNMLTPSGHPYSQAHSTLNALAQQAAEAEAEAVAKADRRNRIHRQVRVLSPFPGPFTHGHGIHVGPDGFLRPSQGSITAFFMFPLAVFVRPDGHPNGLAARMFYQLRLNDLLDLERSTAPEHTRADVRIGGLGHGLWLSPDGSLMFGFGIVMQVFHDVFLAQLSTMLEPDVGPSSGYFGADPNPGLRPELRFR